VKGEFRKERKLAPFKLQAFESRILEDGKCWRRMMGKKKSRWSKEGEGKVKGRKNDGH